MDYGSCAWRCVGVTFGRDGARELRGVLVPYGVRLRAYSRRHWCTGSSHLLLDGGGWGDGGRAQVGHIARRDGGALAGGGVLRAALQVWRCV